ncbi:MAG: hypothetical protein R3Y63_06875 [Eubacteriales bacterium]
MKLSDFLSFDQQHYFHGAVQADWFYDLSKRADIATSYVFHGRKYYGVTKKDVATANHRLLDTASFVANLTEKLASSAPSNYFLMTIAGYGTGKSHLAVSLASLFSGASPLQDEILHNLSYADAEIAHSVTSSLKKKNFVIVLNGMNNFNLDAQIFLQTKVVLEEHGMDPAMLQSLTKSYQIARHFVERNFHREKDEFEQAAQAQGIPQKGEALKELLLSGLEGDSKLLSVINQVYAEQNGDTIQWDRGLCGADILAFLEANLCGEGKAFHKVLLLFDEFGRYIEYVASHSAIAGEAALQQLFETIQSAQGNILFVGFIQNELTTYLSRMEKTSNIVRYVGRYQASENLYLSSNFETILASRIQKFNPDDFEQMMSGQISRSHHFFSKLHQHLLRWTQNSPQKGVWTEESLFSSVILKGCYPLHPITVWLLSNLHQWLQQRSALTFAAEILSKAQDLNVSENHLPFILPIEIVDSGIYHELLSAEEKGLISSQFCMLYRDILVKLGNKLSPAELSVLKGILILNISGFSFREKEDAHFALSQCVYLSKEDLEEALKTLERSHGVIAYDDNANTYDLLAEASGFNEFKRICTRYYDSSGNSIAQCDEALLTELGLTRTVETSFAQQHHVSSMEWCFGQRLMDSYAITESFLDSLLRQLSGTRNGETPRGQVLFAYCASNEGGEVARLSNLYQSFNLQDHPVLILFLNDEEGDILATLNTKIAIQKFSASELARFQQHATAQIKKQNSNIHHYFRKLTTQRYYVGKDGLEHRPQRLNALCLETFSRLYPSIVPFMFDGFEKKNASQAKKYLYTICSKLLDHSLTNMQSYQGLTQEEKNRVKAVLSAGAPTAWKVFDAHCQLTPPACPVLSDMVTLLDQSITLEQSKPAQKIFAPLMESPYGMNEFSLVLFMAYYIEFKGKELLLSYKGETLPPAQLSKHIFKQGKLVKTELMKIGFQKNPWAKVDVVAKKSREILSNTEIEQCQGFRTQLQELVAIHGTNTENQLFHVEAKSHLEDGIRLYSAMYDGLKKVELVLTSSKNAFQPLPLVGVFALLSPKMGLIEKSSTYQHSAVYEKKRSDLYEVADGILKEKYPVFLEKSTCKITQLTQYSASFKKLAKGLRGAGYEDFALATEVRFAQIEKEVQCRQQYESSFVELERDLSMYQDPEQYQGGQCKEALVKFNYWTEFFNAATDLPSEEKLALQQKIEKATILLEKRLQSLEKTLENALILLEESNNFTNFLFAQKALEQLDVCHGNPELQEKVKLCLNQAAAMEKRLQVLPNQIDSLEEFMAVELPDTLGQFEKLFYTVCQEKRSQLQKEEEAWLNQYQITKPKELKLLDATTCTTWMKQAGDLPDCLSKEAISSYESAKILVEERLHQQRVDGVVAMFQHLSPEEQKECLARLQQQ